VVAHATLFCSELKSIAPQAYGFVVIRSVVRRQHSR
jgi:hypothetical protein